tara:strand:- start:1 stop:162 length:162 start_codon:yes stop_codon:yes gene_type:complete
LSINEVCSIFYHPFRGRSIKPYKTTGLFEFRLDQTKDFFNGKRDAINLDYFDL